MNLIQIIRLLGVLRFVKISIKCGRSAALCVRQQRGQHMWKTGNSTHHWVKRRTITYVSMGVAILVCISQ